MPQPNTSEIKPPRGLRGRRARKIWRELAPLAASSGALHAASAALLQRLCVLLASTDPGRPEDDDLADWLAGRRPATAGDLAEIRELSRTLRLLPK